MAQPAMRLADARECGMNVGGHMRGIAADITQRAFFKPGVNIATLLAQTILHIDLVGAVARERDINAAERAALEQRLPFDLIKKIAAKSSFPEEELGAALRRRSLALLHEGAIGGNARARADHDDRNVVGGQTEMRTRLDIDRQRRVLVRQ